MLQQLHGKSSIRGVGTGPGEQTIDGCSVELYLLLKPRNEPEVIESVVSRGATILELGCGVGRVTHELVKRGFEVNAVDNSKKMLAHVKDAEKICSDIETLELDKKFDAVLLASNLINIPINATRRSLLKTCKRHLKPDGVLVIECFPVSALKKFKSAFYGIENGVETYIDSVEKKGTRLSLVFRWQLREKVWTQSFETEILDQKELEKNLSAADLKFKKWLDDSHKWFSAVHTYTV